MTADALILLKETAALEERTLLLNIVHEQEIVLEDVLNFLAKRPGAKDPLELWAAVEDVLDRRSLLHNPKAWQALLRARMEDSNVSA